MEPMPGCRVVPEGARHQDRTDARVRHLRHREQLRRRRFTRAALVDGYAVVSIHRGGSLELPEGGFRNCHRRLFANRAPMVR